MKYGFIGCGNMGGALIRCAAKSAKKNEILIADKDAAKCSALKKECDVVISDNKCIATTCDYIFLGVKPQYLSEMLAEIKDELKARKGRFVLVSMAAGTPIDRIKELAGNFPVIRIMPNLPVAVGEGMVLYDSKDVKSAELKNFLAVMKMAGVLCPLEEKLIDAGSAISGCGPAYVFMFIEALADGGVYCGLPRDKAQLMAAQTLLGSAKLLMETGKHPEELKDAVCSPAGTTIAGVMALEEGSFRSDAADAVIAAYERTLELKNGK